MLRGIGLTLLLIGGIAPAVRGDLLLLVQDDPATRDLTLSVHGRQALSADASLRDTVIFVQVKRGVAELRGHVSTEEQRQQATRIVEDVSGVLGVRNYLEVRAAKREPAVLNLEPEPPSSARAASPNMAMLPEIPLSISGVGSATTPPRRDPVPMPMPMPPPTPVVTIEPTQAPFRVDLLTPTFAPEPLRPTPTPTVLVSPVHTRPEPVVVLTRPEPSGLDALLAEAQFREIKVEQRGSAVYVHQHPGQGARVMALARRLQDVPGVEEIVLVPAGR